MAQPFYHLRPNKYIDRYLFLSCLDRLGSIINIQDYRYIGFGSYYFDDFKQIHEKLNIQSMISLESNPVVFARAEFNVPYHCIRVVNQTSTEYISTEDWNENGNIIWLDYTSPSEIAQQFSDIASLTNILGKDNIIRVTLNANVSALGEPSDDSISLKEYRYDALKKLIEEYIPSTITPNDFVTKKYPFVLLQCLKKMIGSLFIETQYDHQFFLPLFSTVYADGQTMVTLTGIILDDHENEKQIRAGFKDLSFVNFEWDTPSQINIPELTAKEVLEINKLLPSETAREQLLEQYNFIFNNSGNTIDSYISFYKYYPCFQSINF